MIVVTVSAVVYLGLIVLGPALLWKNVNRLMDSRALKDQIQSRSMLRGFQENELNPRKQWTNIYPPAQKTSFLNRSRIQCLSRFAGSHP
jgi:hypothetical protein